MMKKLELIFMKLRNFKGLEQLELELNAHNAKVYGDNATGKTTVFDGFLWLLFDKDSSNKKDFAIKTLTVAGKERHNLEHTIEAEFLVNGSSLKLKKVFKEVWTKKRGAPEKTFTGHTTEYFVDDVPLAKKEYVKKIEELVEEDTFKLLTSPSYFNEQVKWQERRKILLEVCGDISDSEVIAADSDLSRLNEVLSGKTIDEQKKIIASKKKHINDQLETIPVRIDEITKMIPEVNVDTAVLKAQVAKLEADVEDFKNQRYNVLNGAAVRDKENELKELEAQLKTFEREFVADAKLEVQKLQVKVQEVQGNIQIISNEIRNDEFTKQNIVNEIQSLSDRHTVNEQQMQTLRTDYVSTKNMVFEYVEGDCTCPTCKQDLPPEQLDAARNEAQAQFMEKRSSKLESINAQGLQLKEQNEQLAAQIKVLNEKLNATNSEELQAKLTGAQSELVKATEKLETAQNSVPDATTAPEYKASVTQMDAIKTAINEMKLNAAAVVDDIDNSINELDKQKAEINAQLNSYSYAEQQTKRINELEAQQQKLAAEYEELEADLFLIEVFTRQKVSMLEERINSKFKYARFKLFEEQINGGLNEVCETLYDGVPYGSGLNNAAKINVGLDIINTLSEHYGIQAPIFVDNAEAVTKFIDVNTQLISLVVSEKDKELRVERDPVALKEAI